ncbi:hypothetical protein JRG42_23115 [Pseudomonas granadensis]|uniref:hypothetical protein n=1 Tax=Pseudomonas granadensis TaxID=1421430 RepID=UPI0019D25A6F|nr:hypothetical protein [Pseudomonas granadensis]MBN6776182.1 hypothetical protein [Pseudomonas granadensis]MBN6807200.1 hypothetical protein [Pseudomonas granadensis]MBN6833952.1 hypothetical protein [Pseudomonas granadensis]MBN6841575.1 hypothetical protein [Pseudomonas granadensis]MBN6870140.1 hypothetical protein [Pseudomonas granadensis]
MPVDDVAGYAEDSPAHTHQFGTIEPEEEQTLETEPPAALLDPAAIVWRPLLLLP